MKPISTGRNLVSSKRNSRLALEQLDDRIVPSSTVLPSGYGTLPLAFEVNEGQAPGQFGFVAQGNGYAIGLAPTGAEIALDSPSGTAANLQLQLVGSNPNARGTGQNELITKVNDLVGSNSSAWLTGISTYGQVEYQDIYPGIDMIYSGTAGELAYDFTIAAGGHASDIQLSIRGASGMHLNAEGELVIPTPAGGVIESAPVAYQTIGGVRHLVESAFVLESNGDIGFKLGAYDHGEPLVIDPSLNYSSYLPGIGYAIAVNSSGDAYVTGAANTGAFSHTSGDGVFVAELNAAGTALIFATYLGNSTPNNGTSGAGAAGSGIALDSSGDIYVTGLAGTGFPTTSTGFQTSSSATLTNFVAELNPSGSGLLYSTYLPGAITSSQFYNPGSTGGAIAVSSAGDIYVTGFAGAGFATTTNAFETSYLETSPRMEAFFSVINPSLSGSASLTYSTYLGGAEEGSLAATIGTGVAVDSSGNAYLTGWTYEAGFPTTPGAFETTNNGGMNAYVAKIDPSLSGSASLVYSTLLGGTNGKTGYVSDFIGVIDGEVETGPSIAVNASGDAYVAGVTTSTTFPTTAGAFQTKYANTGDASYGNAFVTELNSNGSGLVYSTYLGGNTGDGACGIALDASGDAYITGWTASTNFPTVNPIQGKKGSGTDSDGGANSNAFVAVLNAAGTALDFSTYLGGKGEDHGFGIALDPNDNIYVTGGAGSTNFPTTSGAFDTSPGSGFVTEISAVVS